MIGDTEAASDEPGAVLDAPLAAQPGRVVWITGLPASGKSTVAAALVTRLRARWPGTALLDGDQLRAAFEHDLGYGRDDRRRAARRYSRLARLLAQQGLHVVVATVSLFRETHRWNRAHLPGYFEVYLRAPRAVRMARDRRGVYAQRDVVGVDVEFDEPAAPHLVIDDDGTLRPEAAAERILTCLLGSDGARAAAR